MARVAVIGLGNMGATLARAFAGAGNDVVAWSRSPERRAAYASTGGSVADSPGTHAARPS